MQTSITNLEAKVLCSDSKTREEKEPVECQAFGSSGRREGRGAQNHVAFQVVGPR